MVVMASLPNDDRTNELVFRRIDALIVGLGAVKVGGTVDEPGNVEAVGITEHVAHEEGVNEGFAPEVHGHHSWQHEAD